MKKSTATIILLVILILSGLFLCLTLTNAESALMMLIGLSCSLFSASLLGLIFLLITKENE